ncbi:MAG: DmpA family aminopeptidase [Actinomycetota bacterium]
MGRAPFYPFGGNGPRTALRSSALQGGRQEKPLARKRAREYGVVVGRLPTGARNAITDVVGVRVGHKTVWRDAEPGASGVARTGVTTVFPHEGLPWRERVYVGTHILNGYGEMIGINQMNEWGLLYSPIVLTSSLAIGRAYDATVRWRAERYPAGAYGEGGDMPVVTESDDSFLNDVMSFPLADRDVFDALDAAAGGDVEEGCVGAGTGMQCFDFKGGIGTASRVLPAETGGYTVGALVLTNFGSRPDLLIKGAPVGEEIEDLMPEEHSEGSCIAVVATDAPMLPHQVRRLAVRAGLGLGRCGSIGENGSGELMIAFSTANRIPTGTPDSTLQVRALLDGSWDDPYLFGPLFQATVEAVEESVVNALFTATTTVGRDGHVLHALPIDRTLEILRRHRRLTS